MALPLRLVRISGPSMVPALRSGDVVLARWRPGRLTCRVGEVVLVALPDRPLSVKRVRRRTANAARATLWLEGDNAFGSTDSRTFGEISETAVQGRILLRLWPHPGGLPGMARNDEN
jgi:hypothetical protein